MKKILVILIVAVISISALSAAKTTLTGAIVGGVIDQATGNTKEVKAAKKAAKEASYKIKTLKGLDNFFLEFDGNNLLQSDKVEIYNDMKQNAVLPSITNAVLGFGVGSIFVGDTLTATIGTILDATAVTIALGSLTLPIIDMLFFSALSKAFGQDPLFTNTIRDALIIGGVMLGVSHIYQAIMPIVHVSKYNKKLRNGLGLTKADIKMALVPNTDLGVTAVASIQF